ncbi:diphthamide synthesis protein [Candidatus Woesearchaeota archaeon]|nr:diphthamide synthesis protein [Candidatus Woesearchaeota archaeon]
MEYDFDLDKVVDKIKKEKAKLACIQLADGIKPKAANIQEYLEKNTDAKVIIWLGSCWGACDVPVEIERLKVDLVIQFGHNDFIYGRYYGGNVV